MPHDVVTSAALLRNLFPRRSLDDHSEEQNWTVEEIEDLSFRSTAYITHNVTGERFEVIVRKIRVTTYAPRPKIPDTP